MSTRRSGDLVRRYLTAYRTGDRKKMESLLADGFTFTSPSHDHIARAQYFERCWPETGRIHAHHIASIMSKGDEAFVAYDCELTNGTSSRSVERVIFDGSRIRAVEVYAGDPPMGIPKADYAEFETVALRAWEAEIMLPGTKAAGTTD